MDSGGKVEMKNDKRLWEICKEIYRKMYEESEPKGDFDKIEKDKADWFMNYYLSEERQIEIVEEKMKEYKCTKHDRIRIRNEVYLGSSPTSVKKVQE